MKLFDKGKRKFDQQEEKSPTSVQIWNDNLEL